MSQFIVLLSLYCPLFVLVVMELANYQISAFVLYLLFIYFSIKPVFHQLAESKVQHLVFGSAVAVSFLWWFRTDIYEGLEIHFLWLTALTLFLGWRWALVSSGLALSVVAAIGIIPWQDIGVLGLIGCVVPILFSYFVYLVAYHKLPRHFFVYIFVCAFFTGAATIALKMFLFSLFYQQIGAYDWLTLSDNYLILIPLLLFPEALLNGMTMTLGVIYRPEWVATFYDKQYLDK